SDQVSQHGFDRRQGQGLGAFTENSFHGSSFHLIVQPSAGPMSVDVIDVMGINPCFAQSPFDGPSRSPSLWVGLRDSIGIKATSHAPAPAADYRAPPASMLQFFQHEYACSLPENETVPLAVEGTRNLFRRSVCTTQSSQRTVGQQQKGVNSTVSAASQDHIGV